MQYRIKKDRIPVLSFFSGGGFLDIGFEKAGFDIVFSNEIDPDFAQFYKEGMSSWSRRKRKITIVDDIQNISPGTIKGNLNELFGFIGGPPCQDFSIRGSKNGFDGLKGTCTFHFYEKIMDLLPMFFLMENVPGLVLLEKTKDAFNDIINLYRDEYLISIRKLNALEFGVPQNRERLFVFGIRKKMIQELEINIENVHADSWFPWPRPIFPNALQKYEWGEPTGRHIEYKLKLLPSPPSELCVGNILIDDAELGYIPNSNEFFKLMNVPKVNNIEEGDTYRPSFKRLHRLKYSPAACYGNNEVHLHPISTRRISVREALRIQGVPDSYILSTPDKLSKKFKMIGNGVPVPLATQIAKSIRKFLYHIKLEPR